MKFKIAIVLWIIISVKEVSAQQEPLFSQFWNAKTYYNPAATGMYFKHQSTTLGRWQNVGVGGQSVSQLLGYAVRFDKLHGGVGVNYLHEEIGSYKYNKVKLNYSYHIKTKKEHVLAFGISAGFNQMKYEGSFLLGVSEDNILPLIASAEGFTGDLGIAYSTGKMNLALSGTQLTFSSLGSYEEAPHVVFMTDYIFGSEEGFQLKPQLFVMSDFIKTTLDVNGMLYWKQKIGFGVSYRSSEEIGFSVNWDLMKKFRIGYSYDYPMAVLAGNSRGSHTGFVGLVIK